jgi:hypothetical protein
MAILASLFVAANSPPPLIAIPVARRTAAGRCDHQEKI